MPELPDVEVFRRRVDANGLHRRVRRVGVPRPALLEGLSASGLGRRLHDRELVRTRRHGKNLFVRVADDGWLSLHFGMTGELCVRRGEDAPPYCALHVQMEDGWALSVSSRRLLGRIAVVEDVDAWIEAEGLGPDPLGDDLGGAELAERLGSRRGSIKSALMDQGTIAGIGNVYADEILFAVGLHPRATPRELERSTLDEVARATRDVLGRAIEAQVDPDRMPDDFLLPRRGEDGECPRCGRSLSRESIAGRTTWFCTRDQQRRH